MTIDELIERLERYRGEIGGDAKVQLMIEQKWPLVNRIHGLASVDEINATDEDNAYVEADAVLYIVEGERLRYGSRRAWDVASR